MVYPNPPIHEAIFDIKIGKVSNLDISYYESLSNNELSDFPNTERKVTFSGKIEVDAAKERIRSEHTTPSAMGIIFSNEDQSRKVQFRKDGYTFNMLSPYTNWEDFSQQAFRFWSIYKDELKPNYIERIALRYINRIHLPVEGLKFEDYFHFIPQIPDPLVKKFGSFFQRIQAPCEEEGYLAFITQTFESEIDQHLPFILDIDVYKSGKMDVSQDLGANFDILRANKNKIFESIIKDKTRELFK